MHYIQKIFKVGKDLEYDNLSLCNKIILVVDVDSSRL